MLERKRREEWQDSDHSQIARCPPDKNTLGENLWYLFILNKVEMICHRYSNYP